jgi:pimeloyl-ACP methyl ester carboxylesterase
MYLLSRGSGHAVLFIHGIPTSNRIWSRVIDQLAGSYNCLAVDLPGLGRSPKAAHRLGELQVLADHIEELRIQHNIDKWHLVGHDAGSAIAVYYAHQFPDRVGRLALLSPALFPDLKPFWLFRLLRVPWIGEMLAPLVNPAFWRIVMRAAVGGRGEDLDGIIEDFHAPFSGFQGAWRLMSLLRWGNPVQVLADVPGFLPQLPMSTVVFQGSRDQAVPRSFAMRASALIPNCRMVTLESGHFIPLNNPEGVASELLRFFEPAGC